MNRKDLISEITDRTGYSKESVAEMVNAYEDALYDAMSRNEVVTLHGFLRFEKKYRKGHEGNDIKNGGTIFIPGFNTIKVTIGNKFKNAVRD